MTSPMVRLPSASAIRAELARRSLAHFFRESWAVLEPVDELVWNWHLQAICDHTQALFEGKIPSNNLDVNVPPGSSKSRIMSVCALAWWWIDHPEFRAIHTSANPRLVVRDSIYTRQLITSPWYQETFRPRWGLTGDQNAKMLFRNTAGGFRLALGSGSAITGERAHGLFMDDMLDAAKAESRAEHESFGNWYDLAFANRLSDPRRGIRGMIGQRLHDNDPSGHVRKKMTWDRLVIRQVFEEEDLKNEPTAIGWKDPRTKAGDLMDPVRFPQHIVDQEKRRLGSRGFSAQHQQRPAPSEGSLIKRTWLRYYKMPRDAKGTVLPPAEIIKILGITRVGVGVDTALSEKTEADNTACVAMGEAQSRFYMLDLWQEKVDAPGARAAVMAMWAKWNANVVPIEGGSSASGKATYQSIHKDTRLPVIEMPVNGDKIVALNAVAPTVEAGVIYLPEDAPWVQDFIESLVRFPTAAHDDDVDAFRIVLAFFLFGGGATGLLDFMRSKAAGTPTGGGPNVPAPPPAASPAGTFMPPGSR